MSNENNVSDAEVVSETVVKDGVATTVIKEEPGFFSWNTVKKVGVGVGFVAVVGLAVVGVIAISKSNGNVNLPNI